ncbi:unnamed protein product, partial [Iphiclides podalirius]
MDPYCDGADAIVGDHVGSGCLVTLSKGRTRSTQPHVSSGFIDQAPSASPSAHQSTGNETLTKSQIGSCRPRS